MPVYHPAYLLRRAKSLKEETERLKASLAEVKKRL
jgi:uracil-DNA glycosylase